MVLLNPSTGFRQRKYELMEQVGEGAYGTVFKARDLKGNRLVALKKVVSVSNSSDGQVHVAAMREVRNLLHTKKFGCVHLIALEDVYFEAATGKLVLVFEYCPLDLSGVLSEKATAFSLGHVKCLLLQLLTGLKSLHDNGFVHRDVKAANLLLSDAGLLKIADMGLMTNYRERDRFSHNVVTLWYRAPELLLGSTKYGPEVDMWSVGCVLIELLTKKSPFPGCDEAMQLELIFRLCGTPTHAAWEQLPLASKLAPSTAYARRLEDLFQHLPAAGVDLLARLLELDPAKRITAEEALGHRFLWSDPMPCKPHQLPRFAPVHEYEVKMRRRLASRARARRIPAAPTRPVATRLTGHPRVADESPTPCMRGACAPCRPPAQHVADFYFRQPRNLHRAVAPQPALPQARSRVMSHQAFIASAASFKRPPHQPPHHPPTPSPPFEFKAAPLPARSVDESPSPRSGDDVLPPYDSIDPSPCGRRAQADYEPNSGACQLINPFLLHSSKRRRTTANQVSVVPAV